MIAMGGNLGLDIDLSNMPNDNVNRNDTLLFSESAGRFLVTVAPQCKDAFEKMCADISFTCIGTVTASPILEIVDARKKSLVSVPVAELKAAWKKPFGDLI